MAGPPEYRELLNDHEGYEKCIKEIIPEIMFFVGDVRTEAGISESSDTALAKLMHSMHALRRMFTVSGNDEFLLSAMPGSNLEESLRELKDFALEKVL